MSNKLLIVVDMQNDFVTGCLGSKEAEAIVPKMSEYVRNFDGTVLFTQDTHDEDYDHTEEGKNLPVRHCLKDADGWKIIPELAGFTKRENIFTKETFGARTLLDFLSSQETYDEIELCGVCTGICVISNAVLAKTAQPNAHIVVLRDLCACVTPETHETALNAMKTLQMEVIDSGAELADSTFMLC